MRKRREERERERDRQTERERERDREIERERKKDHQSQCRGRKVLRHRRDHRCLPPHQATHHLCMRMFVSEEVQNARVTMCERDGEEHERERERSTRKEIYTRNSTTVRIDFE